jgi:hypothetical protein
MKKKIIYAVCLILLVFTAPSCSKACKNCKLVTRDSNGNIVGNPGDPTQYCGVDLTAKEIDPGTTVGGNTTKYECD